MPRPPEIAADARALYGPPSVRPAAGDMGDGALWVDPGDNQALWQVQSGNWRQIALPPADVDTDDDSSVPAGVPLLRGPYVVNFSDIAHDGDTLTLWTPAVGDIVLAQFTDTTTAIDWDHGTLNVGQMPHPEDWSGYDLATSLTFDHTGSGKVIHTTDPVVIQLANPGPAPDATAGHVALYFLVARAVAP